MFRTETDREKLLFDGTLQYSFAIKGLQVGDELDYAFTTVGKNPAYGDGYFVRHRQVYSTPAQAIYSRNVIAADLPIHTKLHNEAVNPKRKKNGSDTVLEVSLKNIPGLAADNDRPSWHYGYDAVEISNYKTWDEVGNHFAPYYNIPEAKSEELSEVVKSLRSQTDDPMAQAKLALNYVQSTIRYYGIEMGVGGFQPRQPSLVLERKFGDCKDVTLLLLTILDELGIQASPVLVHSKERAGFMHGQPGY